jgi:uncharacterized membrane protein
MITVYSSLKFLHIVGAIGWLGGFVTFSIISARSAREKNPAVLATLEQLMRFNGMAVIGPASGLTLLAGIVMIAVSGMAISLWVIWGFAAIIVSIAIGAALIGPTNKALREVAAAAEPSESHLDALRRRLVTLNIINILVLLSAVWAMVAKPSL